MGFYNVSLFAYNYLGCLDSTSNQVAVVFDKLFPPNAFSPNAMKEEDREWFLANLDEDPSEKKNYAKSKSVIVKQLQQAHKQMRAEEKH